MPHLPPYFGVVLVVPAARLAVWVASVYGWSLVLDEFHNFLLVCLYVALCQRPTDSQKEQKLTDFAPSEAAASASTHKVKHGQSQSIAIAANAARHDSSHTISAENPSRPNVAEKTSHAHAATAETLVSDFLQHVGSAPSPSTWRLVASRTDPELNVHQHVDSPFRYRLHGTLNQSPAAVFRFLSDIESRAKWDDMVAEARVVQHLNATTRIIYLRMKPVWPTASRDMVLLSHFAVFKDGIDGLQSGHGRVFVNVTQSITHPSVPERTAEGIVRMQVGVSGQMLRAVSAEDDNGQSLIWQLADGDPRGWIPSSVVNFIATQAVPRSFAKLNRFVEQLQNAHDDEDAAETPSGTRGDALALAKAPPTPPSSRSASSMDMVYTQIQQRGFTANKIWWSSSVAVGAVVALKLIK